MLWTVRASSWMRVLAAKKPFFNNVLGSLAGLVLGLFWCLGCSVWVSVFVGASGAKASMLAAAGMPACGGVWVTVR